MGFLKKNASSIVLCIVELFLGILFIVHSESFIKIISIAFGVIMIIGGVLLTIMYFTSHAKGTEDKYLFNGLTYLAFGIVLIVKYGMLYAALDLLFVILALVLLMAGFERLQEACDRIRSGQKKWVATFLGALVEIVLGILVLVLDETKWLFVTIGIIVIAEAVYNFCVIVFLNNVHNSIKEAADAVSAAGAAINDNNENNSDSDNNNGTIDV